MILKEIEVQQALGQLLKQMHLIPADHEAEDLFFHNIYWKAQLYSFFNADIWVGVSSEATIRHRINEKFSQLNEKLKILYQLEQNPTDKERLEKIVKTISGFDSSNGLLTNVIERILKMNHEQ